jgi:hypothetical protein
MYIGNNKGDNNMSLKQEILELIEYKKLDLSEYKDAWELHDALDYDGSLHELIDGNIDIYNHDLREWAVDNYGYVEEAMSEGLVDTRDYDYHRAIQSGQYVSLREEANQAVEEIFNEFEPEEDDDNDLEVANL